MLRINDRIDGQDVFANREEITFTFNGRLLKGYKGEPVAAALLANGIRILRYHEKSGRPRGIYCGIGHCFECRVTVNGTPGIRACITPLQSGMVIVSEAPGKRVADNEN